MSPLLLRRALRPLVLLSLATGLVGLPGVAEARTETLRWAHPNPGAVSGFRAYKGSASGSYTTTIELGKPTPDASGVFSFPLTLGDTESAYIVLRAYDASNNLSTPSNERLFAPSGSGSSGSGALGAPGTPTLILP